MHKYKWKYDEISDKWVSGVVRLKLESKYETRVPEKRRIEWVGQGRELLGAEADSRAESIVSDGEAAEEQWFWAFRPPKIEFVALLRGALPAVKIEFANAERGSQAVVL